MWMLWLGSRGFWEELVNALMGIFFFCVGTFWGSDFACFVEGGW